MTRGIFQPEPTRPTRSWRRLHASTWLLLGVLAVALMLIVLPGERRWNEFSLGFEYGWPLCYRIDDERGPSAGPVVNRGGLPAWLFADSWQFHDPGEWKPWNGIVDVACGLAILTAAGVSWEWWRRRRQHWYQFGLKEILLVTLLTAAALGYSVAEFAREQRVTAALPSAWILHRKNIAPLWLTRLAGEKYLRFFDRVEECWIGTKDPEHATPFEPKANPAEYIPELNQLRSLRSVHIETKWNNGSTVFEESLTALCRLERLEDLSVSDPRMTNADLQRFYASEHLQRLRIGRSQVDDLGIRELLRRRPLLKVDPDLKAASVASLEKLGVRIIDVSPDKPGGQPTTIVEMVELNATQLHLERLRELTRVTQMNMRGLKLTSSELSHVGKCRDLAQLTLQDIHNQESGNPPAPFDTGFLRNLNALTFLDFGGTSIGDEGLVAIESLKNLETLQLVATGVTDAGLPCLRGLPRLRNLWLGRNAISDAAVPTLEQLTELETLYLEAGQLSRLALAGLRRSLPKCRIVVSQ